ncbi:peptidoglycan-binding protein, partial [Paenibacillus darwinianus]
MFQPSDGLRFDVYERVHLPQDVADIHELEEIELTPYIQVVRQDEQVLLKGHLLLSGVYSSQGDAVEARTLEHWIPVEITLPVNRVNRPEDITVDIENFDVDLLSARTLNITGVLSLKGIEARDNEPSAAYAWGDEPFTVVHRRDPASEGSQRFESSEDREIPGNPVDPQSSISSERFADSASPEGPESPESLEVAEAERTADYASQDRDAAVNAMNAFVEDQLKARTAAAAPPFVPGGTGVADVSAESSHAAQPDNREAEPPAVA